MTWLARVAGAFGRADAYRDAAGWSAGQALGYAAVLITVLTVIVTVKSHVAMVQGLEQQAKPWVRTHMPEITIQDGKVSSPAPQPYVRRGEDFVAILDTTGATTQIDASRGLLLTADALIYKRSPIKTERYSLAQVKALTITAPVVEGWLTMAQRWLWVAIGVSVFVGLWIAKLLQVLLWSLLGLAARAVFKRRLAYRGLLTVGVYALTVPTLLEALLFLAGFQSPGALMLGAYLGYLVWGVSVQIPVESASAG